MNTIQKFPKLEKYVQSLDFKISSERQLRLQPLVNYIRKRSKAGEESRLNFICTHNSRRSQFSQIWAQTAAACYGIDAKCFSGGVEVTAFNQRAVASIERAGFKVEKQGEENPHYSIFYSVEKEPIQAFSKFFNDVANPSKDFAAIMTCSDADANCPFIPGAERISLPYDDPKEFDDTPDEASRYDERCRQIASEFFYVFSKIK